MASDDAWSVLLRSDEGSIPVLVACLDAAGMPYRIEGARWRGDHEVLVRDADLAWAQEHCLPGQAVASDAVGFGSWDLATFASVRDAEAAAQVLADAGIGSYMTEPDPTRHDRQPILVSVDRDDIGQAARVLNGTTSLAGTFALDEHAATVKPTKQRRRRR